MKGIFEGIRGPMLLEVAALFHVTVQTMSGTLISASCGAMLGAIICT